MKRMSYGGGATIFSELFDDFILSMAYNTFEDKIYYSTGEVLFRLDNPPNGNTTTVMDLSNQNISIRNIEVDLINDKFVWSDFTAYYTAETNGTNVTLISDSCTVQDISLVPFSSQVYWINENQNQIGRSFLNGTGYEKLIDLSITNVSQVRVDLKNNQMFFIQNDGLYKSDLNLSNVEALVTGISSHAMDIDIRNSEVYFNEFQFPNSKIRRVKMDGTGNEVFLDFGDFKRIGEIVIDQDRCELYYIESNGNDIYRVGTDGCNDEMIIDEEGFIRNIDIHSALGKIYWWQDSLCRSDLDGSNRECLVPTTNTLGYEFLLTADNIYWYDYGQDILFESDLDGTNIRNVVTIDDFVMSSMHCGDTMSMVTCLIPNDTAYVHKITIDSTVNDVVKIIADSCITSGANVHFNAVQCIELTSGFATEQGAILEINVGCP